MKTIVFRLFFTCIGAFFILLFALPWNYFGIQMPLSGQDYKLGLDLQGGIELDYKVDLSKVEAEEDYNAQRKTTVIEGLKSIIDKRIESLNISDSVITSSSYAGEEHIIVQIPLKGNDTLQNASNIEKAKAAIGKVVKIEFKEARDSITSEDLEMRSDLILNIFTQAQGADDFIVFSQETVNNVENAVSGSSADLSELFSFTGTTLESLSSLESQSLYAELIDTENSLGESGKLLVYRDDELFEYLFLTDEPSIWKVAEDSQGRSLDDRYFQKASVQMNQAYQPMVELSFNNEGAEIFGELTARLIGEPLAIFVGGELLTAPRINERISGGKAVITGNYTSQEASKLANDINTGVVPAPIYLTSERTIDARLGQDSLEKIIYAGIFAFAMIFVFLIVVYRVSGLVAAIALFTYIVITLAILKQFGVVLTLASIAGLVLSLGIAIDANILIFERIKDELRTGTTIREAQRVGFEKSFSAIWDANVTGLIVSVILFVFGINMIKGFGFILGLGILVSLFTVFFISRLFIRALARSDINKKTFIGKL